MRDVRGKYIWILGASSGIGAALANELAARGAHVIVSARRADPLSALCATLPGQDHMAVPCDVADPHAVMAAMAAILDRLPHIDSVIFMAAIYAPHDGTQKDLSFIHDMLAVNLGGAFNMLDAVQPYFQKRRTGQIVLCASVAGYRGLPTGQPYCATKAALINLAESLKIELEPDGIDVKVICPGFVKTPLTDKNDFPMPMVIQADAAARAIANGLCRRGFEIHFPRRFTYLMKALRLMPGALFFWIVRTFKP